MNKNIIKQILIEELNIKAIYGRIKLFQNQKPKEEQSFTQYPNTISYHRKLKESRNKITRQKRQEQRS